MKKRLSLTVGIPAYNEEGNIGYLLDSIFKQKSNLYTLKKVIIVSDHSTDNTSQIVKHFQRKYPRHISLIERNKRAGKATALNVIYKKHNSDLLFQPDADIVLKTPKSLNNMVKVIASNPNINLVSCRHIPIEQETLISKFAKFSYISFEDAFLKLNNANNFYSVMSASLIRGSFSKSFKYPKNTQADQCYLYAQATKDGKEGYAFAKNAFVLFRPIATFQEWRQLGIRSVITDKEDVKKYFGEVVLQNYKMPLTLYLRSLIKFFIKNPIYMSGSIVMNLYIRLFPLSTHVQKMWEPNYSSKVGINISK